MSETEVGSPFSVLRSLFSVFRETTIMSFAYIGFGSNVGDRLGNITRALQLIANHRAVTITKKSRLYETEPVGYEKQTWFLNGVIEIKTSLSPSKLLRFLKHIEHRVGRKKTVRWGPREIDLDILLYNHVYIDTLGLTIPHPHMHERGFVLVPLAEISPQVVHPILQKNAQQLLAKIADSKGVKFFGVLE